MSTILLPSYAFSSTSNAKLDTCDLRLQSVFRAVIEIRDCSIICGVRGRDEQNEAFRTGNSEKEWPFSLHNTEDPMLLVKAVDVYPYPIDLYDKRRFDHFAGIVLGVAFGMGIDLTWGGDWDSDLDLNEHKLQDLGHYQLRE